MLVYCSECFINAQLTIQPQALEGGGKLLYFMESHCTGLILQMVNEYSFLLLLF